MAFDNTDSTSIVAAYTAATTAGDTERAGRLAHVAACLGQELKARIARCEQDRCRCHESALDEIAVEEDHAVAELAILEAVPALKVAIDMLPQDEVIEIWSEHGPSIEMLSEDEDA